MTHFINQNGTFSVMPHGMVVNNLPVGTYSVGLDMMRGYFLSRIEDIRVTHKVYGNVQRRAERVMNTFLDRPNSTGVLLLGKKGTGKTMLAKMLSEMGRQRNFPTLVINSALSGEGFNQFITSIAQPCVVIFDEFEKVYDLDKQNELLTLFDGVYPSKKLFILTSNEPYDVSEYLKDRPGRVFYSFDYNNIPHSEVIQYLSDSLNDKSKVERVAAMCTLVNDLSYDIMKAVCEDVNRYPDVDLDETFTALNLSGGGNASSYELIEASGTWKELVGMNFRMSPFSSSVHARHLINIPKDIDRKMFENMETLRPDMITSFTMDEVRYKSDKNNVLVFRRIDIQDSTFLSSAKLAPLMAREDDDSEYEAQVAVGEPSFTGS